MPLKPKSVVINNILLKSLEGATAPDLRAPMPSVMSEKEELSTTAASLRKGLFRQYLATFIATMSVAIMGMAIGWPSAALPKLLSGETHIQLTKSELSWMVALMYVGNMVSPVPSGYIMDRYGRKATLLSLNVLPLTGWALILLGRSPYVLYLARFLFGLWLGIVFTVLPVYLAEIAEPKVRGSLSTFFSTMNFTGTLLVFIIGPYVSYDMLAILSGLLPIVFFFTFSMMPESPYYLLMKDNHAAASKALDWLRGRASPIELHEIQLAITRQMSSRGGFRDVVSTPGNRKALLIVSTLMVSQMLSGITALVAYSSTTLPQNALGPIGPNECVIIFGSIMTMSGLVSTLILDRFRRKLLISVSAVGCGTMMLVSGVWFFLDIETQVNVGHTRWVPFMCYILYGGLFSVGLGPAIVAIKGETFAANIKGPASAVTTMIHGMTAFVINKSFHVATEMVGVYLNYWIYAACCFLTTVFTLTVIVETRGKTLQQIQDRLNRSQQVETKASETQAMMPLRNIPAISQAYKKGGMCTLKD